MRALRVLWPLGSAVSRLRTWPVSLGRPRLQQLSAVRLCLPGLSAVCLWVPPGPARPPARPPARGRGRAHRVLGNAAGRCRARPGGLRPVDQPGDPARPADLRLLLGGDLGRPVARQVLRALPGPARPPRPPTQLSHHPLANAPPEKLLRSAFTESAMRHQISDVFASTRRAEVAGLALAGLPADAEKPDLPFVARLERGEAPRFIGQTLFIVLLRGPERRRGASRPRPPPARPFSWPGP